MLKVVIILIITIKFQRINFLKFQAKIFKAKISQSIKLTLIQENK